MRANLEDFITQRGKNISRRMTHEMAKNPKETLAASSFSEYLKTLAASMNTSHASCRASIMQPMRKNLETENLITVLLWDI